ncbi:hypothetical protein L2E82_49878 [Cichorium intybus]|uniref:Uncharacterized protein n=1 Tax=Cichorium intybus TaxID=13427 RepID=A0ACB8Z2L0_CICIN|nr:hypothetical protein L2E82_49878 [Cichorium intybus]
MYLPLLDLYLDEDIQLGSESISSNILNRTRLWLPAIEPHPPEPTMDEYEQSEEQLSQKQPIQELMDLVELNYSPLLFTVYGDEEDYLLRTYEVSLEDGSFIERPWTHAIDDNVADLLIPVPPPLCGVLVIGRSTIAYCCLSTFISIEASPHIKRSYKQRMGGFTFNKSTASVHFDLAHTRVNLGGWRYLLGDHVGQLRCLLYIVSRATALEIQLLAGTSIASTISYLGDGLIYVGSMFGDSQIPENLQTLSQHISNHHQKKTNALLVRLNLQPDTSVNVQGITGMWS